MDGGETSSADAVGVRPPADLGTRARIAIGLVAVLVIVLAGLALLNSFYVDYVPGDPATEPGGGDDGSPSEGGFDAPDCERFVKTFFWAFVVLAAGAAALFTVAVVRREHHEGRIGSSIWGLLSVVTTFLAILALGAWRIFRAICDGALNCENSNDGTYTSFLLLLGLTLVSLGIGIFLAHRQRRNFLSTGWGLLGLLVYLPTVLTGFTWFLIRTFCTPDLSCALRDQFLADLATIFWFSLLATAVTIAVGIFVQKRFQHGFWRSGWGVVAILLGLLAVLAGSGYLFVDGIKIPGCDEFDIEEAVTRTCEEMQDHLQGRIGNAMLGVLGLVVVLGIGGYVFNREDPKAFWSSIWAILAYVGLALLVILGIAYLLTGSMCDEPDLEEGDGDGGRDGSGSGQGGQDGQGGSGDGGDGGDPGNGGSPGGGGPTTGDGGGGGGTGTTDPTLQPVEIDPASLTWVLIALLIVIGLAALVVLLRYRRVKDEEATDAGPVAAKKKDEAAAVMAMLKQGRLQSDAAVIAAYRAFVDWTQTRDMGPAFTETPREHAARVAKRAKLPAEPLDAFVAAYEVARLSHRKPDADEERSAVSFAKRLRRGSGKEGTP